MTDERTSFSSNTDAQSSVEQSEPTTLKESCKSGTEALKANKNIECANQFSVKSVDLILNKGKS